MEMEDEQEDEPSYEDPGQQAGRFSQELCGAGCHCGAELRPSFGGRVEPRFHLFHLLSSTKPCENMRKRRSKKRESLSEARLRS